MKNKILGMVTKLQNNVQGATAIEYGLIAALVAVVLILGLTFLGTELNATFNAVGNELSNVN